MSNNAKKAQIRDAIRLRRSMLDKAELKKYEAILTEQFVTADDPELLDVITASKTVAVYAATRGELSCDGIAKYFAKLGKTICYPRVDGKAMNFYKVSDVSRELVPGSYGILEPNVNADKVYPNDIDIMIVPAIAYNDEGIRLGQGGGYYDRFIADMESSGKLPYTVGVCYDFQIYSAIPVEPHDIAVDCIMCVYTGDDE